MSSGRERKTGLARATWYPLPGFDCELDSFELPHDSGGVTISVIKPEELRHLFSDYPVKGPADDQCLPKGRYFKLVYEGTGLSPEALLALGDLVVAALRLFKNGYVDAPVCSFSYEGGYGGGHSTPSRAATAWDQGISYCLAAEEVPAFASHWDAIRALYFSTLDWRGGCVLSAPMRRFMLSYDERPPEDIYLDRWMALEMLLDPGAKTPRDFFRRVRLSLLISGEPLERKRIYLDLAELADVRGGIVHRGQRMHFIDEALERLTEYVRRALVGYAAFAASTGRSELHGINNMLDDQILLGILDLPLNVK